MRGTRRITTRNTERALAAGTAVLGLIGVGLVGLAPAAATPDPAAAGCPPSTPYPVPQGAQVIYADLDGDGTPQPVALGSRPAGGTVAWDLVGLMGPAQIPVGTEIAPFGSRPELRLRGAADVDGDGDQEVLVVAPMGASTEVVGVWGVRACRWVPLTLAGEPRPFLVGASVMHGDGARCTYGDRNVLRTYHSARIAETDRHEVTVAAFALSDLGITPLGGEERITVTDDELARDWPADFLCDRGMRAGPPAAVEAPRPAPAPPKAPTPVKARPAYTG